MGSVQTQSPDFPVNELVGFLALWAPEQLKAEAAKFPELRIAGFYEPGVMAGVSKEAKASGGKNGLGADSDSSEARNAIISGRIAATGSLLLSVAGRAEETKIKLIKRVLLAARLRITCQILSIIAAGGTLALLDDSPKAKVTAIIGTVSAILGLFAQRFEGTFGSQSAATTILEIGRDVHEARLLVDEIEHLQEHMQHTVVRKRLEHLCAAANDVSRKLNDELQRTAN